MRLFFRWKSTRGARLENSMQLCIFAADNTAKQCASCYLKSLYVSKLHNALTLSFALWKRSELPPQEPLFDIDNNIIKNQAKISSEMEKAVALRDSQARDMNRATSLKSVNFLFKNRVRGVFVEWKRALKSEENDIFFEYMQFLEEQVTNLP